MTINEVRKNDCSSDNIFQQRVQVRRFMMQLEGSEIEGDGGVTWLELHALFRLHGGKVEDEGDEHNPRTADPTCTKSLQSFKTAARWLTTFCVSTEEEWDMQTSYSRHNRLSGLGITNKHAAVRGMLVLDETTAKAIATQIMHD